MRRLPVEILDRVCHFIGNKDLYHWKNCSTYYRDTLSYLPRHVSEFILAEDGDFTAKDSYYTALVKLGLLRKYGLKRCFPLKDANSSGHSLSLGVVFENLCKRWIENPLENGRLMLMMELMELDHETDQELDLGASDSLLLRAAVYHAKDMSERDGPSLLVLKLLGPKYSSRIKDVLAREGQAFSVSCEYGMIQVVKAFLEHPCVRRNWEAGSSTLAVLRTGFIRACIKGEIEVVGMLVKVVNKHEGCLAALLTHNDCEAIVCSALYGQARMLQALLLSLESHDNIISSSFRYPDALTRRITTFLQAKKPNLTAEVINALKEFLESKANAGANEVKTGYLYDTWSHSWIITMAMVVLFAALVQFVLVRLWQNE